jgi:eukaryotic-like serine/threonine-protein kinase
MEQLVPHPQIALPDVPAVGQVIAEKYRVEGILGVGGMGVVLGARHLQLGQLVAIKVLSVSGDKQQGSIERFLREGRAAAALSSDHVVRIYDVGQLPSGIPFMVMERLRGQDLASTLDEHTPMSIADAVEYVAQATVAIVEAHEVGIIHRDLKPSNLFLTRRSDGTACVKVLDFGISKQLTDGDTPTIRSDLTSTRQVMGSPAYMPPEQVRDAKTVDHRTDIWALGVTLYELLTQRAAFDADTLPAVCAAIAADPPVPVRTRRPEVPEALEAIVLKCLEKTPAQRFQTARALLAALRTFQGKSVEFEAHSAAIPLATESSASLEIAVLPDSKLDSGKLDSGLAESGPRSVDSFRPDPADGTLLSGRTPSPLDASDTGTSARDDKPALSRRMLILALLGLVLIGAATARVMRNRSTDPRPAVSEATRAQSGEQKTHFVLRIESNPSQALVLEGGNPLGVTPLSIEVDRTIVQRSARRFVVHKEGFVDVNLEQEDATTDVHQNLSLAPAPSPAAPKTSTVALPPTRRLEKLASKQAPPLAKAVPSSPPPGPGIRITR